MKNNKMYISGTLFFLKNIWFSPSVNYYYIIFGIVLLILKAGQDLKQHDILVAMLLLSLSSFGIRQVLCNKNGRITPWFHLLPLPKKQLLQLLVLSSLLYSLIIQTVLITILSFSLGLPFIGNPHITFSRSSDGEIMSIASGYTTDLSGRMEIPFRKILEPSLFFGIVTTSSGYPVFPFWQILLPLFTTSLTFYFIVSQHLAPIISSKQKDPFVPGFLMIIVIIMTACVIIDSFIDSKTIWTLRTQLDTHHWIIPLLFTTQTFLVLLSINNQYRKIFKASEIKK